MTWPLYPSLWFLGQNQHHHPAPEPHFHDEQTRRGAVMIEAMFSDPPQDPGFMMQGYFVSNTGHIAASGSLFLSQTPCLMKAGNKNKQTKISLLLSLAFSLNI